VPLRYQTASAGRFLPENYNPDIRSLQASITIPGPDRRDDRRWPAERIRQYGQPTGGDEEMGRYKKAIFKPAINGTLAMVLLGMGLVAEASAGCGDLEWLKTGAIQPGSWQGKSEFRPGSLLLIADREGAVDRIVGFWKVTTMSEGNPGIPDGTVLDAGFAQWHADGTEILNSSRPAASGNFCLGVWKKTGSFHYTLNHFTLGSDPSTDTLSGRGQLREEIELDHGGDSYFGTFTSDGYDLSGHLLFHRQGSVIGTRITVNTSFADLL
jgi:hypothetical protein